MASASQSHTKLGMVWELNNFLLRESEAGNNLVLIIDEAQNLKPSLLEQIRLQAERERLVYEVTSKIRRSTDIQSIMMTTASELTRITGARYAKLQIRSENDKGQEGS